MTTPSTAATHSIRLALLSAEIFQTTSPTARARLAHECYAPDVIAYSGLTPSVYHGLEEVLGWAASLLDKNDKGEDPPKFELKAVAVGECWDLVSLEWELRWLNDAEGEGEGEGKYKGEVLRGQDVCQFERGDENGAGGKIVKAWTVIVNGRE